MRRGALKGGERLGGGNGERSQHIIRFSATASQNHRKINKPNWVGVGGERGVGFWFWKK